MIRKLLLDLLGHRCAPSPIAVIPFSRATLCLACDCITESKNDHCEFCKASGSSLLRLGATVKGERVRALSIYG